MFCVVNRMIPLRKGLLSSTFRFRLTPVVFCYIIELFPNKRTQELDTDLITRMFL